MDTQHLHEFVVLAELCNYQEAAEVLHVSQSALSKHIQKLEEELDVELFERTARSVVLSKYGESFWEYAKQITELRETAWRELQKIRVQDDHRLVVAYPPALERYGLIELLVEFRQAYPEYVVETVLSVDPVGAIRAGRCDFAFAQEDLSQTGDITAILYQEDYPVVVLPATHPLATKQSVAMEQLCGERFILHNRANESTTVPQMTLMKLCEAADFSPDIALSASFSSTIVSLVSQGLGIAVMQRAQIPSESAGIVLVRIQTEISADIQLVCLKTARQSPVRTAFLRHVQGRNHSPL